MTADKIKRVAATASKSSLDGCERGWQARLDRLRYLRDQQTAAKAALCFYEAVLVFELELARRSDLKFRWHVPFREQIDLSLASSAMPRLLQLAIEQGPEKLRQEARSLEQEGQSGWYRILESAVLRGETELCGTEYFFARACLQPIAENLQRQLPPDPNYHKNLCPACGGFAQLAILRAEGEGRSRSLECFFCLREWLFRRLICPWCGEEDKEKLPRYSAPECVQVDLEACDTCRRYLKAVDLTVDGRAVPLIDEAAFAVLDVWAVEHGYSKITQNLVGF
jgi:formate dehydrogenase maturation protein FdhE